MTARQQEARWPVTSAFRRGQYFEEFSVGQTIVTPGRTIAESDIIAFAGLTGDFNLIHTDAVFAQTTPFGQRVAHGLFGLSIASGLATRTGVLEGTVMAWRDISEWKFVKPVLIGDTIHAELTVEDTKPLPGSAAGPSAWPSKSRIRPGTRPSAGCGTSSS